MDIVTRPEPAKIGRKILLTTGFLVGFFVIGGLLAALLPALIIISLISIIGIPIGFPLLWSIPVLAYALPIIGLWLGLRIWKVPRPLLLSSALVLVLPQLYVVLSNARMNAALAQLVVPDMAPTAISGTRPNTLVFVRSAERLQKPYITWCDWPCQAMLLQNQAQVVGIGFHTPNRTETEYDMPAHQPRLETRYYALRTAESCPETSTFETGIAHWLDLPGFLYNQERRTYWAELRNKIYAEKKLCLTELTAAEVPAAKLIIDYTEVRERNTHLAAVISNMQRLQVWQEEGGDRTLLFSRTLARARQLSLPLLLTLEFGAEFRSHYQFSGTQIHQPPTTDEIDTYFNRESLVKGQTIAAFLQQAGYLPELDVSSFPGDKRELELNQKLQ